MVVITEDLVRRKSEHNNCELSTLEEVSLHQLEIERLENLDKWCRELKILYLQGNLISKVENVGRLKKLEYLNLALNNIERIENLERCESLKKLDFTVNFIYELTGAETLKPLEHLRELYLTGNPCTDFDGYRGYVVATLPQLTALDGKDVSKSERIIAVQNRVVLRGDIMRQMKNFAMAKAKKQRQKTLDKTDRKCAELSELLPDVSITNGTPSEIDSEKEFWNTPCDYTPESRREIHEHLDKKKRENDSQRKHGFDEKPPPREIKYFSNDGRTLNINQAKLEFKLDETPTCFQLDLECYKYLDTSLIDVEVEPLFVRVVIKGKVFQLVLNEDVCVDKSSVQRSQTTGHILIRLPKAKEPFETYKSTRTKKIIKKTDAQNVTSKDSFANNKSGVNEKQHSMELLRQGTVTESNKIGTCNTKADKDFDDVPPLI